jgi:hypothetical protein
VGGEYEYQVWAYDVLDFIDVKNGIKQPWEIEPYDVWTFDWAFPESRKLIGGTTFDPATGRLFVSQQKAILARRRSRWTKMRSRVRWWAQ